jgi:hypothetical protein
LGWLFPIYGKIKNVPNHQSDMDIWSIEIDGLPKLIAMGGSFHGEVLVITRG